MTAAPPIRVVVLSTAECASTPPTVQLILDVSRDLGLSVDLSHRVITSRAEAREYRFQGSPTVLIEGLDLQPEMRVQTTFGFT